MDLLRFDGHIVGASFASGDTIVAGRWPTSPFGPFADVMWRRPDGSRTLLAPTEDVRAFVLRHYAFDRSCLVPVRVERDDGGAIRVDAGSISLDLGMGSRDVGSRLLRLRPRWLRERPGWIAIEDVALRPVVGRWFGANHVHVCGRTRADAREWYAIHDVRVAVARGAIEGRDLGETARLDPAGFGFSEFPSRASIVRVTSLIERR